MSENNENNQVIRETIKDKPPDKKRMITAIILSVACGVLFGCAAAAAFHFMSGYFADNEQTKEEEEVFEIPEEASSDYADSVTEEEPTPPEDQTEDTEVADDTTEPEVVVEEKELTIEDCQTMNDLIYDRAQKVDDSVVTVLSVTSDTDIFETVYENSDVSSGILIDVGDKRALVLTDYSSVRDAASIRIRFDSGQDVSASIQGYDEAVDLCVLKVMLEDLTEKTISGITAADMGSSFAANRGDIVMALGARSESDDLIFAGTITSMSGQVYREDGIYGIIETDMPSNSLTRGFFTDISGKVIGIISGSEDDATLNAIGISDLKSVIERISNREQIAHLGVVIDTVTNDISEEYGVPRGALVKSVQDDSPALEAGIRQEDIIVGINNDEIFSAKEFMNTMKAYSVGETVDVTVMRRSTNDEYTEVVIEVEL